MNWKQLPPHIRTIAEQACTPRELDAWKLSLDGAGYLVGSIVVLISVWVGSSTPVTTPRDVAI